MARRKVIPLQKDSPILRIRRDISKNPDIEQVWARMAGKKLENITTEASGNEALFDSKRVGNSMIHNHPMRDAFPSPQDILAFASHAEQGLKFGWIVRSTKTGRITRACCVVIPKNWKREEHENTIRELKAYIELLGSRISPHEKKTNLSYLKKLGFRLKFFGYNRFKGTDATRKLQ